jgi:DnaJ-class molecular chaperone
MLILLDSSVSVPVVSEDLGDPTFGFPNTVGKCHGHGFMAFDWCGTNTCHGIGTALHMQSKTRAGPPG